LIAAEFDMVTCQEQLIDHAVRLPLSLFWPDHDVPPVEIVPVSINTVQFPLPTTKRTYALGQAIGRAIAAWESDKKVIVMGTGGLSHQLEGTRAGYINKQFDLQTIDAIINNPGWLTQFTDRQLVANAGTQGVELLNWLAMRGALEAAGPSIREVHRNYHIPISNTATGVLALEPSV
jgi:protocatechuate 4,5-dioxygenase beta chain